mmetsp:Transcript_20445/g.28758  ORF Transcript_20445/g.28758 Transcript_20445/m.28758 type:complete len:131 (+) Transcript_20445:467-859(+)
MNAYVKFPLDQPNNTTALTDSNWGPQDASVPHLNKEFHFLGLFKSRFISGYLIWRSGPLHWSSERQTLTARSSTEAEIYATDESAKSIQQNTNILEEIREPIPKPIPILNDNSACVTWSSSHSTKGLWHL